MDFRRLRGGYRDRLVRVGEALGRLRGLQRRLVLRRLERERERRVLSGPSSGQRPQINPFEEQGLIVRLPHSTRDSVRGRRKASRCNR